MRRPLPAVSPARAVALRARMTLDEKLAQLVGYWVDKGGEVSRADGRRGAAPPGRTRRPRSTASATSPACTARGRSSRSRRAAVALGASSGDLRRGHALGHPGDGARGVPDRPRGLDGRDGVPTPLGLGRRVRPRAGRARWARRSAEAMRARWASTRASPRCSTSSATTAGAASRRRIGEDPYLVGTIGAAYVRGLQVGRACVRDAQALRRLLRLQARRATTPRCAMGRASCADVLLPPFEMALREAGARLGHELLRRHRRRAVAVADADAAHRRCCATSGASTARWSPTTSAVAFLHSHARGSPPTSARRPRWRSRAGIDVELPTGDASSRGRWPGSRCTPRRCRSARRPGRAARACRRRRELGLLDADFEDARPQRDRPRRARPPGAGAPALAEHSVVLLTNDGLLPLAGARAGRIAAGRPQRGPRPTRLMGCYSFANHVLPHHPGTPSRGSRCPRSPRRCAPSCTDARASRTRRAARSRTATRGGFAAAVAAATAADVAVVVGDRAGPVRPGHRGRGQRRRGPRAARRAASTSSRRSSPPARRRPWWWSPGRPYAIGWALEATAAAASAVPAGLLPGRGGRRRDRRHPHRPRGAVGAPARVAPRSAGAQPYTVPAPRSWAGRRMVTSADSTAGRCRSATASTYTTFDHFALEAPAEPPRRVHRSTCRCGCATSATVQGNGRRAALRPRPGGRR